MIPVLLKLSNFTSYGESPPELDFTKFKLAAISGPNGAGKSSLLDAITWALWGSSRAGESSDDLVRLGTDKMHVEFQFELDGHLYTVKRLRSKKSGGNTTLELWSGFANSPLHNLTEGTIKTTQQKIINTLHLTFETFTNSSFIRQGNAGEFTTKGPTDRKRILAEILGLDHYEKLEEKAKEKSKEIQTRLTLLDYQLLEIETELSTKDEKEKDIELAELEAKKTEDELKEVEKEIKELDLNKQTILSLIQILKEKSSQIELIKKEILDIKQQIELKIKAKEEFETILSRKALIKENYLKIKKLEEEKKHLDEKRSQLIKVKDELAEIQKIILVRENKRQEAITEIEVEIKKFQTEIEQLDSQNAHLKTHKDSCPTCGQAIGLEKNKEIIAKNNSQIKITETSLNSLYQTLEKYKSVVLPEHEQAQEKESQVKKMADETRHYFDMVSTLKELDRFKDLYLKLQQAETGVKTHQEAILDLEKIYQSRIDQIKKSENNFEELSLHEKLLKDVEEKITAKDSVKQKLTQKAYAARSKLGEVKQLRSRFETLEDLLKTKRKEKTKLGKEKEIYEELTLAFGKRGIQAMIIESAIPEIEDEANKLLDKLTDGRMRVSFITQKETKTKIKTIDGTKEHALVETLDIIISDEMGERAYEMYSGGETFRINFAIRLAISKLLAHRAGARLQFLVIDEGFGTQDSAGRARLVEVIDQIKNDFEKILIITHLEELKEEFPTRIEVSKNSEGSTFEIVGV